ncbi:hypothetical protein B566_EDAN005360 [Ephemera danica]|nr:hypothetical protein B566_EDAN005360 [Ephemera danica]
MFLLEPPTRVEFSNSSGGTVDCSAHGSPAPRIEWTLADGTPALPVPQLRRVHPNGTLEFPPFSAERYRHDVHTALYRCRARNQLGEVLSRDVHDRASGQFREASTKLCVCVCRPWVELSLHGSQRRGQLARNRLLQQRNKTNEREKKTDLIYVWIGHKSLALQPQMRYKLMKYGSTPDENCSSSLLDNAGHVIMLRIISRTARSPQHLHPSCTRGNLRLIWYRPWQVTVEVFVSLGKLSALNCMTSTGIFNP